MTIRLAPDSLRLRLDQIELARLRDMRRIEEFIEIPGCAPMRFSVQVMCDGHGGFSAENGLYLLTATEAEMADLVEQGTNKYAGIRRAIERSGQEPFQIVMEVDVFSKERRVGGGNRREK